jgi:CheY-like chemotaxis protein
MSGKTVLIIDDDWDSIQFASTILSKEGISSTFAIDGEEGLDKAKKERPDLILLDVQMPKMDGMEVFENLCKDKSTKGIPVIMVTGIREKVGIDFDLKDMEKLYGAKPQGYVEKPVVPRELIKKVKKYL